MTRRAISPRTLTARSLIPGLSELNMNENAVGALTDPDKEAVMALFLRLYSGRRTTFPIRAMTRFYQETFGFEFDEITGANAGPLVERIRATRVVREANPDIVMCPPPMDYLPDH